MKMFVLGALFAPAILLSVHARPALQSATELAAEAAPGSGEQGASGQAAAAGTQQVTKTQRISLF